MSHDAGARADRVVSESKVSVSTYSSLWFFDDVRGDEALHNLLAFNSLLSFHSKEYSSKIVELDIALQKLLQFLPLFIQIVECLIRFFFVESIFP